MISWNQKTQENSIDVDAATQRRNATQHVSRQLCYNLLVLYTLETSMREHITDSFGTLFYPPSILHLPLMMYLPLSYLGGGEEVKKEREEVEGTYP